VNISALLTEAQHKNQSLVLTLSPFTLFNRHFIPEPFSAEKTQMMC